MRGSVFEDDAWDKTVRLAARLEGLATAVSAERLTRVEVEEARGIDREMRIALERVDPARFAKLSSAFHAILCPRHDDQRLIQLLRAEWIRLELVRQRGFWYSPGRAAASREEHELLLDLIEAGPCADEIEHAARQHKINTLTTGRAQGARMFTLASIGWAPT